jgi:hypothetical protein
MPKARPPLEPVAPLPLTQAETAFIKETVRKFFGDDAIVRNFGSDPKSLLIHVETSRSSIGERDDCIGIMYCRIDRPIDLTVTKRGSRVRGLAKIAYRQGTIL